MTGRRINFPYSTANCGPAGTTGIRAERSAVPTAHESRHAPSVDQSPQRVMSKSMNASAFSWAVRPLAAQPFGNQFFDFFS